MLEEGLPPRPRRPQGRLPDEALQVQRVLELAMMRYRCACTPCGHVWIEEIDPEKGGTIGASACPKCGARDMTINSVDDSES
jgi:hypothetical protein